jgi:DNA polymerase III subunit gamma/tau
MSEVTLDKKYRPPELKYVVGNESTVKAIERLMDREEGFPSTILLHGPSGCGKTTIARIIAYDLGVESRDLKEFNIADMRGIDMARAIEKLVYIRPLGGRRVIILDECHMATRDFENAMLKVLEEPPPDNHFILCTTEPNRLIKTIRTRATAFRVDLLNREELNTLLDRVVAEEKAGVSDSVLSSIIELADGCPRQALVILDSVIGLSSKEAKKIIQQYEGIPEQTIADLCQALLKHRPWKEIAEIIKTFDREDAERARNQLLAYFEKVLFSRGPSGAGIAEMMDFFTAPMYASGRPGFTQACLFAWLSQEGKK